MDCRKKCDEKYGAHSTLLPALLIGRSSHREHASYVGGAAKENYTAPHDIALR
jgi:hypothetical protein